MQEKKTHIENQPKKKLKEQEHYTKSQYKCDKCKDKTFILINDTAHECECRAMRIAQIMLKESGITEEFKTKTFENYDYTKSVQNLQAYEKAKQYIINFNNIKNTRKNTIMFLGQVGSGKTHLALAIANNLLNKGISVIYMGYREIITNIKQNVMDHYNYIRIINRYKNANVLLIDDLFKGGITQSDINIMFELINHRYLNNMPTIITSEKTFEKLNEVDEAIASRLMEMGKNYLINLIGKKLNYRIYG